MDPAGSTEISGHDLTKIIRANGSYDQSIVQDAVE